MTRVGSDLLRSGSQQELLKAEGGCSYSSTYTFHGGKVANHTEILLRLDLAHKPQGQICYTKFTSTSSCCQEQDVPSVAKYQAQELVLKGNRAKVSGQGPSGR